MTAASRKLVVSTETWQHILLLSYGSLLLVLSSLFFFCICSCTNGGGHEDCDKEVEEEAQKPTSCGMITDPNGWFTQINVHTSKQTQP